MLPSKIALIRAVSGVNTRLLGWGVGFFDMDNDGWLDILMSNGHVYPEVDKSNADLKYAEHKYLYRNLHNGRFEEVTDKGGPGILENAPARGCAFGDYDNDGDIDIAVNCVNAIPQLLRCDSTLNRNWIKIKLVGVKSNRTRHRQPRHRDRQDQAGRRETAGADGRAAQRRQLLLAERSAHAFRAGPGDEGGHGRDPLAERAGGPVERSGGEPAVRDPGGRQDPEERRLDACRQARSLRMLRWALLFMFMAACLPASGATEERCPWLNIATAGGMLGGHVTGVRVTRPLTGDDATCSFVRSDRAQVAELRIEVETLVSPASAFASYLARCHSAGVPLKGIGNQAVACTDDGRAGQLVEQVIGRVRSGRSWSGSSTNDRAARPDALRDTVRKTAEQVAGILF